jgi:hypothetical protein
MKRVVAALLIALGVASSVAAQNRSSAATDAGRSRWTTNDDGRQIRVRSSGTFELTDDDRDVKSVPPGGYFELSSRNWLSLFGRRYVVRGNEDGTVTRTFSAGASELPIDAAARAWIGDTLQSMIRQGFAAEARVKRILAQQGPSGVLDAASDISNDYGQAIYFRLAAELGQLDPATAARAFRQAGEEIGSDFELARVLVALIQVVPIDAAMAPAFIEATRSIGSDFEHSRVLRTLIASQRHTTAVVSAVLTSSTGIGSDFEKSRVLRELAEGNDLEASSVVGLIRAAGSIGSDFEQSRVLRQIVSTQPLDETSRQTLIDAAGRIRSEYERTRVLSSMVQSGSLR